MTGALGTETKGLYSTSEAVYTEWGGCIKFRNYEKCYREPKGEVFIPN